MKTSLISLALSFTMLLAIAFQAFTARADNTSTPKVEKSDNITYIDVGIYQPNVEDCYETLVPDTGIEQDWINLYPNPNPGLFTLEAKLPQYSKSLHIHIYDITGKLVFRSRETIEGHQFSKELNVSFLEKGVYFIRITGEHRVGVKQIIIN